VFNLCLETLYAWQTEAHHLQARRRARWLAEGSDEDENRERSHRDSDQRLAAPVTQSNTGRAAPELATIVRSGSSYAYATFIYLVSLIYLAWFVGFLVAYFRNKI
jgi:hypothetical protein